jgi:hypothetical protein
LHNIQQELANQLATDPLTINIQGALEPFLPMSSPNLTELARDRRE